MLVGIGLKHPFKKDCVHFDNELSLGFHARFEHFYFRICVFGLGIRFSFYLNPTDEILEL